MIRLVNVSVHQDSVVNAVQHVSELPLCYTVYTVKHKEKLRFFKKKLSRIIFVLFFQIINGMT